MFVPSVREKDTGVMVRGLKTGGAIVGCCWFGEVVEPMLMCLEVGRLVVRSDSIKLLFRSVEAFQKEFTSQWSVYRREGVCMWPGRVPCSS